MWTVIIVYTDDAEPTEDLVFPDELANYLQQQTAALAHRIAYILIRR